MVVVVVRRYILYRELYHVEWREATPEVAVDSELYNIDVWAGSSGEGKK